ncbi:MAG: type II toxin-antitoxin system RelE/ParE family toxin [Spirochaetes bacterium]|nr:MAG: type II toxin-antitoxin system RelE/ParE family toxin [Spirochaetota bacterium]
MSLDKVEIEVLQTPIFSKKKIKLHKNQIKDLGKAVKAIIENPEAGTKKKGILSGVRVYKFKMVNHESLLAYQWDPKRRILVALGVHENFYRDVENSISS